MVASPNKRSPLDRIPDLDKRRAYMAQLHVTLMHGEPWHGILKPPPPREPKPFLTDKDESLLNILIECGPTYKAVIAAKLGDTKGYFEANLARLQRQALIEQLPSCMVPGAILWRITDAGLKAKASQRSAFFERSDYRNVHLKALPKRQPEQSLTPAHVAKPEEYIHTSSRMLTEDQVAAESSPCRVYRPNPKTGRSELVETIPAFTPPPPIPEKPKPPLRGPMYPNILDDPRCAEAVRLYRDEGLRYNDVARSLHIRNQRLKEILTACGVAIRPKGIKEEKVNL